MHIKKNVFDNVFNTIMDIQDETKDNVKARMNLIEYCRRKELELHQLPNGRYLKLKAKLTLFIEQRKAVYKWVSELKIPDGYASNLHRCANLREGKFFEMKSHNYHVFKECLLPIAFAELLDQV